jgi:hypothetical protein
VTKGHLDERLILNHIIVLNNMFGPQFVSRIIFLKLFMYIKQLKPFLLYLNLLPDTVRLVKGRDFPTIEIEMDWFIVERLRTLDRNAKFQ